jgi:methionyl-tRNA formyltransferase
MKKDLRIVFMGTPEFAIPSLHVLLENDYHVVAVITAPDKPRGRGRKLSPSSVKSYALEHNIPVLQPGNLKDPSFIKELRSYRANIQIVVAFRMLPEVMWSMPEYGTINLHASILPDYRGSAPINWVLINGESKTGLTTLFIKQEIDTGNIIFCEEEDIRYDDDAGTLHDRMMVKGGELVLKTVRAVEQGNFHVTKQDDTSDLKKAPKIFRDMCEINWDQDAGEIYNFVRGLSPFPGAWTVLNNKMYKIFKVQVVPGAEKIGNVGDYLTDSRSYLNIQCSESVVSIVELQPEGKRRMKIEDFFRGNRL